MKKVLMLMLSCILVLSLTACGKKVTVESLMKGANAKSEKAKTMSMNMKMNVDLEIAAEGTTMKLGAGGDLKCESDLKNKSAHIDGNVNYSAMGTESKVNFETYTTFDNDTVGLYMKFADNWMKQEMPMDEDMKEAMEKSTESSNQLYSNLFEDTDKFKLAEETEKLNDKDVYVVSGELTLEDIIKAMESVDTMKDSMDDLQDSLDEAKDSGFDMAAMPVDIKYYFDKKSKNLVKCTIDMQKTFDEILKKAMEAVAGLAGDASAANAYEIKVNQFLIEVDDIQYDTVKEITVPDEAKNAPDMDDADSNPFSGLFGGLLGAYGGYDLQDGMDDSTIDDIDFSDDAA